MRVRPVVLALVLAGGCLRAQFGGSFPTVTTPMLESGWFATVNLVLNQDAYKITAGKPNGPTWSRKMKGAVVEVPVVEGEDLLLWESWTKTLRLHDLLTGKVRWESTIDINWIGKPAIHGDLVLFPTSDRIMVALNRKDGREIWKTALTPDLSRAGGYASGIPVSSTVFDGDSLYVTTYQGKTFGAGESRLFRLDLATGAKRWEVALKTPTTAAPRLLGPWVVVHSEDLLAFRKDDGGDPRVIHLPKDARGALISLQDEGLLAPGATATLWVKPDLSTSMLCPGEAERVSAHPAGKVYWWKGPVKKPQFTLSGIQDGKEVWSLPFAKNVDYLADGTRVVEMAKKGLVLIDAATGQRQSEWPLPGDLVSGWTSALVQNGVVLRFEDRRTWKPFIALFEFQKGVLAWQEPLEGDLHIPPIVTPQGFLVWSTKGNVAFHRW